MWKTLFYALSCLFAAAPETGFGRRLIQQLLGGGLRLVSREPVALRGGTRHLIRDRRQEVLPPAVQRGDRALHLRPRVPAPAIISIGISEPRTFLICWTIR